MGMILGWHRRAAVILAGQLPEDPNEALLVLEAAKELVEKFLMGHAEKAETTSNIIPFRPG